LHTATRPGKHPLLVSISAFNIKTCVVDHRQEHSLQQL
jgi:hypothetical protein